METILKETKSRNEGKTGEELENRTIMNKKQ